MGTSGPWPEGGLRICSSDICLRFGTQSYANAYVLIIHKFKEYVSVSEKKGTLTVSLYMIRVGERINHKEWDFEA